MASREMATRFGTELPPSLEMDGGLVKAIYTLPAVGPSADTCDPYRHVVSNCKPLRLIPVSHHADIGDYYTWKDIKAQVSSTISVVDLNESCN